MLENNIPKKLDDYFADNRTAVYFCRISTFSENIKEFIVKYYTLARKNGAVIEGRIPNPDESNLSYYYQIMGNDFYMDISFINTSFKKWLPRIDAHKRDALSKAIFDMLCDIKKEGKNENIIKNTYIKFMCWLYYKFENTLNQKNTDIPKILYEGEISAYELRFLKILSLAGCDALLLQYNGDDKYIKLDSSNKYCVPYNEDGAGQFPKGFCLKALRDDIEKDAKRQAAYGQMPSISNNTNAWLEQQDSLNFSDNILKPVSERGNDSRFFYNCFYRVNGVEDKTMYVSSLYGFFSKLKALSRKAEVCEGSINPPAPDEVSVIKRGGDDDAENTLLLLSGSIKNSNSDMKALMTKAFLDVMLEESKKDTMNINRLTSKAVYILCLFNRYSNIFQINPKNEVSCFIMLNGCRNENECLFAKILSRLPVDVLVLNPEKSGECILEDKFLMTVNFDYSMSVKKFPAESSDVFIGTAAYHAERELDEIMYRDSGMYRDKQYSKANSITLNTMYEEIPILWNEELKYRTGFSSQDDFVNMPVIFAKICGVKNGDENKYWKDIKSITDENTLLYKRPYIVPPEYQDPDMGSVYQFLKNGKLDRNKLKGHRIYKLSDLREEMQDYMLDKLQLLIDKKIIKGTFENGTEYTIISTVVNLNRYILRLIQQFDFTKKNPKLIYINTTESHISLRDAVIAAFLNLVGFDVLFFVPTGYMTVERYYNQKIFEEHQIGKYVYDLVLPDFRASDTSSSKPWYQKLLDRRKK